MCLEGFEGLIVRKADLIYRTLSVPVQLFGASCLCGKPSLPEITVCVGACKCCLLLRTVLEVDSRILRTNLSKTIVSADIGVSVRGYRIAEIVKSAVIRYQRSRAYTAGSLFQLKPVHSGACCSQILKIRSFNFQCIFIIRSSDILVRAAVSIVVHAALKPFTPAFGLGVTVNDIVLKLEVRIV